MRRFLAILLTAAMLVTGIVPVWASEETDVAVPDGYVTDNLVMFLDANNNTGNGFDANASAWVDLADSTGATAVSLNGNSWGTDVNYNESHYMDIDGYIKLPEKVRQAICGENWTIEFLMDDYPTATSASNIRNILALTGDDAWISSTTTKGGTPNDNFVIFQSAGTQNLNLKMLKSVGADPIRSYEGPTNAATVNGVTNAISFDTVNKSSKWYQDAVSISTKPNFKTTGTVKADGFFVNGTYQTERKPQVIFGAATDTVASREFTAKVKAIRVYSDVLTEEELAQNAKKDNERYYAKAGLPEGYVEDNLVMFLDANKNNGRYYDANATAWVDLTDSTGNTVVGLNGNQWGTDTDYENSNYLDINGYIKLPDKVREAISGENWTIEFILDDYDTTPSTTNIKNVMALTGDDQWINDVVASGIKGATPNDYFVMWHAVNSDILAVKVHDLDGKELGRPNFNLTQKPFNGITNTLIFESNNTANNRGYFGWYQNGSYLTMPSFAVDDNNTVKADGFFVNGTYQTERKPQVIFGAASDTVANREFAAKVKAIRVYSDRLTEAEIAQNAKKDQERYYTKIKTAIPDGYVKDNLVMFLDANNNTGTTFDANATGWVDIADETGETVVDLNGNSWGSYANYKNSNYLDINGYIKLPDKVREVISGENWTIEFLMDNYPTATSSSIRNILALTGDDEWISATTTKGGTPNDNFVIFQSGDSNELRLKMVSTAGTITGYYGPPEASTVNGVTNAISFDTANRITKWYQDAAVAASCGFTNGGTVKADGFTVNGVYQTERKPQVIFGAATDTVASREFTARVKAIRVYNDVLSADELAQNALTDAGRYYTETTADHTHVYDTEYSSDENYHWIDCTLTGCTSANEYMRGYGEHVYDDEYDMLCNVCKYTRTTKLVRGYDVDIYEPDTDINVAPIVMQTATESIKDISAEEKRPSSIIFDVKLESGVLNAYSGTTKLGTFADLYTANCEKANVGARISDMATAKALDTWLTTETIGNLWVISNDVEQLNEFSNPSNLEIVDDTVTTVGTPQKYRYVRVQSADKYLGCKELYISGYEGDSTGGEVVDLVHNTSGEVRDGVVASLNGSLYNNGAVIGNIIDGSEETSVYLDGESGNTYFQVDLGAERTITNIHYKVIDDPTSNFFRYENFKIQLSSTADFSSDVVTVMTVGELGDNTTPENYPVSFVADLSGETEGISGNTEISISGQSLVRCIVDFTGDTVRGPGNVSYSFDTDGNGTVDSTVGGEYANTPKQTFEYVTYEAGEYSNVYSAMEWDEIYDLMITKGYRTMLLPEEVITKDEVHYLIGSLMTVIAETDAATEEEFYDLVVSGVHGILSENYAENIAVLEGSAFDLPGEEILVRGASVVGHRGDMGNPYLYPENSVESIVAAAESGASSVEFDVYMTMDGYMILMHNPNIAGFFDYPEDYTGTRVDSSINITQRYWEGDLEYLISTYNPDIKMQHLYELYEAIDTEYPELRLHHEMKDTRPETINRALELMEEYGLRARSDMMSINYSTMVYTSQLGISTQYIGTNATKDSANRMYETEKTYRSINSTWHTMWECIDTDYLEEMKHYGYTAYPWPTYDEDVMDEYYVQGYHGFTTNIVHDTDDYIRKIVPTVDTQTAKVSVTAYTLADHKDGVFDESSTMVEKWWLEDGIATGNNVYDLADFEIIAIAGDPVIDNTAKTATGDLGDMIAVRYEQQLNGCSCYVYSNAIDLGRLEDSGSMVVDTDNKAVTVSATLVEAISGKAIIAAYSDNQLVAVDAVDVTNETDILRTLTYSGNAPTSAKVIFLRDLKTIEPLRTALEISK